MVRGLLRCALGFARWMSRPRVEFVASTTIAAVAVLWAAADRAIGVGVILGIAAMSVAVAVVLWLVLRFWPDR